MSTVTLLIKKDAEAPVTLAAAGITSCVPGYKANGVDMVTFTQSKSWLAAAGWPHLTQVAFILRTVDGAVTTDRCVFVGTVEGIPRAAAGGGSQSLTYTAYGPAYALQRCDYSQEWTYTKDDGTTATAYEPTVVLGEDNNGFRLTSGGVIGHAAAYAISRGVSIDLGTIAAGVTVPLDERDNIKVWDAFVSMLSYTPDYVVWFDYDHQVDGAYVPALNVTAPADMPVVTKELIGQDAATARFDPRYDIIVPGIQITYRWTGEYDGRTVKSRYVESAGDVESYRRVSLVYDLEGSRAVFISQEVEVEDYPADWTSVAGKNALITQIPVLAQMTFADWSVTSVTRPDSAHAYPSRLVSGSVPKWTAKHSESDTFKVRIAYKTYSSDTSHLLEEGSKDLTFSVVSTDAVTRTYRRQTEWVEAEPVPAGLAAALLASWNRLHYDGQVTFHQRRAWFDIRPGMLLACTGGLLEWETMEAVVQDVTVDVASGTTTVRVGTCGRLQADNLLAIFRAARGRRFSQLRMGRDSGDGTDGNQIDGALATPNDNAASGIPPCLRQRFAVEAANAHATVHMVDIDPAMISPDGIALEDVAQTIKIRKLETWENDGVTSTGAAHIRVQKQYVLASEPSTDRHIDLPVGEQGPQGEPGAQGPQGEPGPAGSGTEFTPQEPLWLDTGVLKLELKVAGGLKVQATEAVLDGLEVDVQTHSGLTVDTGTPSKGLQLVGLTPGTAPAAAFVWGYNGTSYGKFLLTTVSLT